MSNKFRNVHAAKEALEIYIDSNRNLDVLKTYVVGKTDRYDVWQCVFEKEKEALRFLQEQELISLLMSFSSDELKKRFIIRIVITKLTQLEESKSPLSVVDAIRVCLDVLGNDSLQALKDEAQVFHKRRQEIIASYSKPDNEWVAITQNIVNVLNTF